MSDSELKVPNYSAQEIAKKAAEFRQRYWDKSSPIDILKICEMKLHIDFIPIPNLEALCRVTSLITSDWKYILIDQRQYVDEAYDSRTNFSVAHEIGHLALHREFHESLRIEGIEDIYKHYSRMSDVEYQTAERQAHAFAGRVLVPRSELMQFIQAMVKKHHGVPKDAKKQLVNKFGVSEDVILRRLQYEKIDFDTPELGL